MKGQSLARADWTLTALASAGHSPHSGSLMDEGDVLQPQRLQTMSLWTPPILAGSRGLLAL